MSQLPPGLKVSPCIAVSGAAAIRLDFTAPDRPSLSVSLVLPVFQMRACCLEILRECDVAEGRRPPLRLVDRAEDDGA